VRIVPRRDSNKLTIKRFVKPRIETKRSETNRIRPKFFQELRKYLDTLQFQKNSAAETTENPKTSFPSYCEPQTPRKCLKRAPKLQLTSHTTKAGPGDRRAPYCQANRRRNPHGRPCLKSNPAMAVWSVPPLMMKG